MIHGDRSQSQRTAALTGFQQGRYQILVATDLASRGIHVRRHRPRHQLRSARSGGEFHPPRRTNRPRRQPGCGFHPASPGRTAHRVCTSWSDPRLSNGKNARDVTRRQARYVSKVSRFRRSRRPDRDQPAAGQFLQFRCRANRSLQDQLAGPTDFDPPCNWFNTCQFETPTPSASVMLSLRSIRRAADMFQGGNLSGLERPQDNSDVRGFVQPDPLPGSSLHRNGRIFRIALQPKLRHIEPFQFCLGRDPHAFNSATTPNTA